MNRASNPRVAVLRLPHRMLVGGLVATAVVVGLIVWLVVRSDSGSTAAITRSATSARATPIGPIALSAGALRAFTGSLAQPVYWLGPEPGRRYELQLMPNGRTFLRYLPSAVKAGDKRAFRSVGTYPFKDSYAATLRLAARGYISRKLPDGWLAVYRRSRPTNIYLARPKYDYQVEVFDSSPAKARQLVASGKLQKVR